MVPAQPVLGSLELAAWHQRTVTLSCFSKPYPWGLCSKLVPGAMLGPSSVGSLDWVASIPVAEKEGLTAALHFLMTEFFSEAQIVISLRSKLLARLAT